MENKESKLKKRISAAFRALARDSKASVNFRASNYPDAELSGNSLTMPKLPESGGADIGYLRGMADSNALYLQYHNSDIHKNIMPVNMEERSIFNMAEIARVEALGSLEYPGVSANIDDKINYHFISRNLDSMSDIEKPPVDEIFYLLVRKHLTGKELPAKTEKLMRMFGLAIEAKLAKKLKNLSDSKYDQKEFAGKITSMMRDLKFLTDTEEVEKQQPSDETESDAVSEQNTEKEDNKPKGDSKMESPTSFEEVTAQISEVIEGMPDGEDEMETSDPEMGVPVRPNWENLEESENIYRVYTSEFDRVVNAGDMYSEEEMARLRNQFDIRLSKLNPPSKKHVNKFLRTLTSQQNRVWEYNQEDGIIDPSRLSALVADPSYLEFYRREKDDANHNTVVSLLLDNSGSMRGRPITVAAMSAEILAKTLEPCGIKVEILGFTTAEWKGGKSRKKWQDMGGVKNPGRLNDILHIVYKSAGIPWKKARKNMGVMLKEGILKENIDGEAILWAMSRLYLRPEKRKILMVISDGAPVDDSTISTNSASYLDTHLKNVIKYVEKKGDVEIIAIGIGHDVTRYYKHAVTIRDVDELGDAMFDQLTDVFERKAA